MTASSARPRLAIVADVRGWAFHNIATSVRRHLEDRYDVDVVYLEDYADYGELFKFLLLPCRYALVHFLWREAALGSQVLGQWARDHGERAAFWASLDRTHLTVSVYDHLLLDPELLLERAWYYRHALSGYTVSSAKLATLYGQLDDFPAPTAVIEDGVDLERFRPGARRPFVADRPLVVGWVGNSRWGSEGGQDPKGLHSVLVPALQRLRDEGVAVEERFADRQVRMVPQAELPDYYASIDVLVCASEHEGTPNPILEAMACGVPFVSTDVGLVSTVSGPLQAAFILSERSVGAMAEALRTLAQDRARLPALAQENLARIQGFTRASEADRWDAFFGATLACPVPARDRLREVSAMVRGLVRSHEAVLDDHRAAIRSNERMIDERDALLRRYEARLHLLPEGVWRALEARSARPLLRVAFNRMRRQLRLE